MSGAELEAALLEELRLRSRLNALVHERAEAIVEAEKLEARAGLPGAAAGELGDVAGRWRAVAERVTREIEEHRTALRAQEATLARLRAPGGEPA